MFVIAFFTGFLSLISTIIFLRATYKKRKKIGEGYEDNLAYKEDYGCLLTSLKVFIVSLYVLFIFGTQDLDKPFDFEKAVAMFFFITIFVTAGAFIFYWWKKRTARIKAGENYQEDENYKKISLHKRILGITCILSLFLFVNMIPEPTPEQHAAYLARMKAEKAEEERLAAEQAEQAKQERIAAAKKAEEERLSAEKAEQDRIAAEKAKQENNIATENKKPAAKKKEEKGFFAGLFDDTKEFVGGVLDNEVHVCDLETDTPGEYNSVYFSPTSKKYQKWGLIFIDEGYKLEVITKLPNGKKYSQTYYFKEVSDGWEYQTSANRSNEWMRVDEDYVFKEDTPFLLKFFKLGSLIFQKSKHFPTLPDL